MQLRKIRCAGAMAAQHDIQCAQGQAQVEPAHRLRSIQRNCRPLLQSLLQAVQGPRRQGAHRRSAQRVRGASREE